MLNTFFMKSTESSSESKTGTTVHSMQAPFSAEGASIRTWIATYSQSINKGVKLNKILELEWNLQMILLCSDQLLIYYWGFNWYLKSNQEMSHFFSTYAWKGI